MDLNRRTAMAAGLGATTAVVTGAGTARAAGTKAAGPPVITVQGESAARTNIPVVRDRRASGGRLLALLTTERPPEPSGWYATYRVRVPEAGVYALTAVATAPVETPHTEAVASYLRLAVSDGPFTDLDHAQPHWYDSPPAWGDLSVLDLGEVELRGGTDTLTFRVDEKTVLDTTTAYVLTLDRFTLRLRPGHPALRTATVARHRADEPARLRLTLDGRARRPHPVRYTVTDHFGHRVATGRTTIPEGATGTTVALPKDLPPGHYRVDADGVGGAFARLPVRPAPTGAASRFGVNVWAASLLPPSRLDEFAAAMRDMGAGWVRDGQSWPAVEPTPGGYDTAHHDRATRTLRAHGLAVLDVLSPAPEWAMTEASLPLPADLRHAYRYARRLAAAAPEALQLSNEPDVDTTRSTGDAHAAFVKAAALGIKDAAENPPLVVLPGIAQTGPFQDLMLANDVVRYADAWAFHGYPDPARPGEPEFPGAADEQHALARRHGADVPLWMTECGAFQTARPGQDLTPAEQAVQARYVVRSMVEGLAAGNARQFWFAAPPLYDDGVWFGLLDRAFDPLPAYSALAALTSLLGAAHFVGPARRLPAGARGLVFDTGRGELVTVVWAPRPVRVGLRGTAYDIMGRRLRGSGPLTASPDPLYVVSRGAGPSPAPESAARTLSDAEHIVLVQRFSARDAAPGKEDGDAPAPYGYRLGRRTRMRVEVYNFSAEARTVTVTAGSPGGGWSVRARAGTRVRVAARGRAGVDFVVTAGSSVPRRVDRRLSFGAVLEDGSGGGSDGGRQVPKSVALVHLK
ncbi:hypothetical protein SLINC_3533 [Streptomyces lincolnensis]|uniref:Uncharacterized protein n=1 Tax=Streptomyces lincolnensis TaxID=1915 RepID=A0A1B1MB99_STRLN|nr:hypothetical protein [Streptomyces lincolnensis]ANS65757.1 hypothetical protein SLINC_3533 [Streptomyces lincolnensis]AXG54480.1 hypothetical protein SLCG_3325 [Streptomyces lincolnensis]QMV08848.1 hypothetical protein GJU35_26535 [Streptomyces lincolnensis]